MQQQMDRKDEEVKTMREAHQGATKGFVCCWWNDNQKIVYEILIQNVLFEYEGLSIGIGFKMSQVVSPMDNIEKYWIACVFSLWHVILLYF